MGVELTVFALDAEMPLIREDSFAKRLIKGEDFFVLYTPSTGTRAALMMGTEEQIRERMRETGLNVVDLNPHAFQVAPWPHAGHVLYVDWTMVHRHGVFSYADGGLVVDTTMDWTLDDSDGPLEFWCDTCNEDVTEEIMGVGLEIDYH